MNDNMPSPRSDLQALRLIRAFLRIPDQQARSELVEQAERLAAMASLEADSSLSASFELSHPADPLG